MIEFPELLARFHPPPMMTSEETMDLLSVYALHSPGSARGCDDSDRQ